MRFLIFEYGESVTDVQSTIEEFDGSLYEYDKVQLENFKNSKENLELMRSGFTDGDNCLFYVYFCKPMNKIITQYVIPFDSCIS